MVFFSFGLCLFVRSFGLLCCVKLCVVLICGAVTIQTRAVVANTRVGVIACVIVKQTTSTHDR